MELRRCTHWEARNESLPPPESAMASSTWLGDRELPSPRAVPRRWYGWANTLRRQILRAVGTEARPDAYTRADRAAAPKGAQADGATPRPSEHGDAFSRERDLYEALRTEWLRLPTTIRNPEQRESDIPVAWLLNPMPTTVDLLSLSSDDVELLAGYLQFRDDILAAQESRSTT